MGLGRTLLLAAAKSQRLNDLALRSKIVKRATRAFMPGERMDDALAAAQALSADGRGFLLTRLGEALTQRSDAVEVRDHYITLFDAIAAKGLRAQVSVKPTQLGLDLSEGDCRAHCLTLAAKAEATGSTLWLDMEDSSYVDRTLALYTAIKATHARAGIALQAYLMRTPRDVQQLLPLNPVIRLVKGAYAEPAAVAYPKKSDTDAAYEAIAGTLLDAAKQGRCTPVFGTHDMALVKRLVARAASLGVDKGHYEIHMLFGIGERDQQALRAAGEGVCTLISYGEAWYRWYMRRLAERPANVWFVAKSIVSRAVPLILAGSAVVGALACSPNAPAERTPATGSVAFQPFDEKAIPNDSMGVAVRRGLYILRHTPDSLPRYATSGLTCTSCHQVDGTKATAAPLFAAHARFPSYLDRAGAVVTLADRVNYCFTRSLAGNALPVDSRQMADILAYLAYLGRETPIGRRATGAEDVPELPAGLEGDSLRGRALYVAKTCSVCHGANGDGVSPFPPLWGARAYSIGASMARVERAAAFIWHNMPQTAPGSLTPQEAIDLAAYINSRARPDQPAKELDWPLGGAPAGTPYDLRSGHRAYRPPPLLPRATPRDAVVPAPPRAPSTRSTSR